MKQKTLSQILFVLLVVASIIAGLYYEEFRTLRGRCITQGLSGECRIKKL